MLESKINSRIKKAINTLEGIKENLEKVYLTSYYEAEKEIDLLEIKEETLGLDFGINYEEAKGNAFRSCIANSDLLEDIQNPIAAITNIIDEHLEDNDTDEINDINDQLNEIYDVIEDEIIDCESQDNIEDYIDEVISDLEGIAI